MENIVYTLMNKETPLCDFIIEGEGELELCKVVKEYTQLPFWCEPLSSWVANRSCARHRAHVNKILEACGGKSKRGFIALTHCLSLTDTLWVKSSREDAAWRQLNLYENSFDEVISRLSFDGNGLFGIQTSTTSPELTTDGAYDKCWPNEKDGIHLIKTGSDGARNTGLEPYGEVLASQVFEKICDSVKYTLRRYDGRVVADCITLNCDRHLGNFGFLVDNGTFERKGLNPCFDFNMAFVPFAEEGIDFGPGKDFDEYLSQRGPVIGSDYVAPARAILTPEIKRCVEEIRETPLSVQCDEKFTQKRLAQMNMIKDVQCERILGFDAKWSF